MRTSIILSILLFCFSAYVSAFSKGAPTCAPTAAKLLAVPNTPMGKQAKLGYTLTLSSKTYTAGGKAIQITSGGGAFKGVVLTVMDATGKSVGLMNLPATFQYIASCPGGPKTALTHTDSTDKPKLVAAWTPPTTAVGKLTVMATFVQGGAKGFQVVTSALDIAGGKAPPATNTTTPSVTSSPSAPTGTGLGTTDTGTATGTEANTGTNAVVTSQPASDGMSISQYSSFCALVLANVAAVVILL
jgi:hypothetical protein